MAFKILLWPLLLCGDSYGFAPVGSGRRTVQIHLSTRLSSTSPSFSNSLDGVSDFEQWFASKKSSGAKVNNIKHALFNSMGRGLEFTSTKSSDLSNVAVVPRKLVLNVPYEEDNNTWDTKLSCKLWEECQKGKDSEYYG